MSGSIIIGYLCYIACAATRNDGLPTKRFNVHFSSKGRPFNRIESFSSNSQKYHFASLHSILIRKVYSRQFVAFARTSETLRECQNCRFNRQGKQKKIPLLA